MKRILSMPFLAMLLLPILQAYAFDPTTEMQTFLSAEDPVPGEMETSEYLVGSVAVGVILLESNGRIDSDTEKWTRDEELQTISKIEYALDWWSSQNPNANVTFEYDIHYQVPTGYEPIIHPSTDKNMWVNEAMNYFGYKASFFNTLERTFVNDLREKLQTDWAFMMFLIDASDDVDGEFSDGSGGWSFAGGPSLTVAVSSIWNLEWLIAHEFGHIFWATDEYNGAEQYSGYLNVPDIEESDCIMNTWNSWNISGKPRGLNGTWGQVGWRDSDGDGIQDIVDTYPSITLCSLSLNAINGAFQFTGRANENPYPNHNPRSICRNNITINRIQKVDFRLDQGEWTSAQVIPSAGIYREQKIAAIVNFTFTTPALRPGCHTVEVRATNQWGNSGYTIQTVELPGATSNITIISIEPYRNIVAIDDFTAINITIRNHGDSAKSFRLSLYCNDIIMGNRESSLDGRSTATITMVGCTEGFRLGEYTVAAVVSHGSSGNETIDDILTYNQIRVTIPGDINADGFVSISDISEIAKAIGSKPRENRWNPNADINEDGVIDILDVSAIATQYGKSV